MTFHDKSVSLNCILFPGTGGLFHSNSSEISLCNLMGTEQDLGEEMYLASTDAYKEIRISALCLEVRSKITDVNGLL